MKKNKGIVVKKYNFSAKEKTKKRTFDGIDSKTIMTIAVILIIIAIVFVISSIPPKTEELEEVNDVKKILKVSDDEKETNVIESETVKEKPEYIQKYVDMNESVVGYIKIDNTVIDYPVFQTDNNEYYMNHDINYDEIKSGSIFMDYRCDIDDFSKTRNIILYGHRMKDGTMFKDLTKYLDEDFFFSNRIIKFDTINEELEWKVFAVFETTTDFYYIDTEFPYDEMWLYFLDECNKLSLYNTNMNFYNDDIVLTLSTCSTKENSRVVVMAKLLK